MKESVYHYAYNTKGQEHVVQGDNSKTTHNTVNQRSVYYPTNVGKGYQVQSDPTKVFIVSVVHKKSGQRIYNTAMYIV